MAKSLIMKEDSQLSAKIRIWVALALLAASTALFTRPQFSLMLGDYHYRPTGLRLIFSAISYQGVITSYPLVLRLAAAAILLSALAAIGLALWRKPGFAAVAAGTGTVLTIILPLIFSSMSGKFQAQGISQPGISSYAANAFLLLCLFLALVMLLWSQGGEMLARSVFQASAFVAVASVALITFYLLFSGLPAILEIGPLQFLFGTEWAPTKAADPQFGILPMMLATIAGTAGAIVIGVPIGLLTAVFLAEVAPSRLARLVRPAVELLAGIPSVIYGFFGLQLLVPVVQKVFRLPTGATLFSAILILAVMILPTIVNTAETGLRAVPAAYREASLALGATRVETIFKVLIPAARSSILSGVILGVGRAIGETMAVIMVAGNIPNLPALFDAVRPLTVGIALEMSYAAGLHQRALFAIGLVLFIFIMLVNLSFSWISKRGVQMSGTNE